MVRTFAPKAVSFFLHTCALCGASSARALCRPCSQLLPARKQTSSGLWINSLGPHEGALADFIRGLKYEQKTAYSAHLGSALAQIVQRPAGSVRLVPVPLHPLRLSERGYNQSALLARVLSRCLSLEARFSLLFRRKNTAAQAQTSAQERIVNVEGAFVAARTDFPETVLLVDDVATTGSTLDACALALEQAGHKVLGAFTLALGGEAWSRETERR